MIKEHSQIIVLSMRILDLAVTVLVWVGCFLLRFHTGWFSMVESYPPQLSYVADVIVISLLLVLLLFGRMGMYRPRRMQSLAVEFWDTIKACVLVWVILIIVGHFLRSAPVSRKLMGMFLIVWPAALIVCRGTARVVLRSLRRRGKNIKTVVIIGAGRAGQKLFHALRAHPWTGYEICYFVADSGIGADLLGVPVRGTIEQIDRIVADHPVDVAFVALPESHHAQLSQVLDKLTWSLMDLNVVPDLLSYHFLTHDVESLGTLPIINLTHSRQIGLGAAAKRLFDIVFSLVALVLLGPLMLVTAMVIRLSSGRPVFYRQRRASLAGRAFEMLKFRSMAVTPDGNDTGEWSTAMNDPRITRVGRIIRKLSLDELPQLINVLRGDMSLVGPRPELPEFIERFSQQIPRYIMRHHVMAGITGWAQVRGYRGRTSLRKRIQYDLDYINRWSFGFDLWILILTVFRGFINRAD